jgi:hypothetical protein
MKFSVRNLWSKVIGLTQNTETPLISVADIAAYPKLPVVVVDVKSAPIIYVWQGNELLETTNIRETQFQYTLEEWRTKYSLVFPTQTEWTDFWACWKDII